MKACARCGESKTSPEYYRTAKGSLMHICKDCHKAAVKWNRLTNPKVREYDRARAKLPARQAKNREISKRWRDQHPDAYKAQNAVNNALRDGRIVKQPCTICGAEENVHGHHCDYSKPLAVMWLCAKCHHRTHAILPDLGGNYKKAPRC